MEAVLCNSRIVDEVSEPSRPQPKSIHAFFDNGAHESLKLPVDGFFVSFV